jgi:hypothetical protein
MIHLNVILKMKHLASSYHHRNMGIFYQKNQQKHITDCLKDIINGRTTTIYNLQTCPDSWYKIKHQLLAAERSLYPKLLLQLRWVYLDLLMYPNLVCMCTLKFIWMQHMHSRFFSPIMLHHMLNFFFLKKKRQLLQYKLKFRLHHNLLALVQFHWFLQVYSNPCFLFLLILVFVAYLRDSTQKKRWHLWETIYSWSANVVTFLA